MPFFAQCLASARRDLHYLMDLQQKLVCIKSQLALAAGLYFNIAGICSGLWWNGRVASVMLEYSYATSNTCAKSNCMMDNPRSEPRIYWRKVASPRLEPLDIRQQTSYGFFQAIPSRLTYHWPSCRIDHLWFQIQHDTPVVRLKKECSSY